MSVINIGLSGLNANRVALNVTALNTANANSVGYTRQTVALGSISGGSVVAGMEVGSGVQVNGIRRMVDDSANVNLRNATTDAGYSAQLLSSLSYIEEVLGADGLNVNETLGNFFTSINEANPEPSSSPLRQQIIQSADLLAQSISSAQDKLFGAMKNELGLYETQVDLLNSDLKSIAKLNEEIAVTLASGGDISGLQDQLEVLNNQVASKVKVNAVSNDKGQLELSMANGEPLVNGNQYAVVSRDLSSGNPYSTDLNISFGNSTIKVGGAVGGSLGATGVLINDELTPLLGAFDDIAVNLADEVNNVLFAGFDMNGNPGASLFDYDPANPAATLRITNITVNELALSADGAPGNGDNLHALYDISSTQYLISGSNLTLDKGYTLALGEIGASTSQAISINKASQTRLNSAQVARDQVSAVNSDEEAANLMVYMNAYNANMKVISTGNQMFESILSAF
ncbi:flagellar hook-associated protein FlgK [Vibrio owensii]|uniref:flagellar hook-associated protein FlgK n=1 Tax=Vibrio owensii TaxID=696485 RepID=UPI0018F18A39|nr:flagellar hook-associated protein FlgK [Vibrio owensii]